MPFEMVSVYTLLVGDAEGTPAVSAHTTADDAWRALDREIRLRWARAALRPRLGRRVDADAAKKLANAWRAADPENRYWNVTVHGLRVPVPVIARVAVMAR